MRIGTLARLRLSRIPPKIQRFQIVHPKPTKYPHHLARVILDTWTEAEQSGMKLDPLPPRKALEHCLDIAFQAGMLKEENRTVRFRLMLCSPDKLPASGPPSGLLPLPLARDRELTSQEIRRLAPAAAFQRSLIGVNWTGDQFRIWGVVNSGGRWVNRLDGGRFFGSPLPNVLVIHGLGAGRLVVYRGNVRIASLIGGLLEGHGFDMFQAPWIAQRFTRFRDQIFAKTFGHPPDFPGAEIHPDLVGNLAQNAVRRAIGLVRDAGHGGTMVFTPDAGERWTGMSSPFAYRHLLMEGPARSRLMTVIGNSLRRISEVGGVLGKQMVDWADYQDFVDGDLADWDEALLEMAGLMADFMSVDGALVMTRRTDILGFGAEIRVPFADVPTVHRALDVDGDYTREESVENVGTRHRAVYRLCAVYPDCIGVVISQDGNVRFVAHHQGKVTYWNQLSI